MTRKEKPAIVPTLLSARVLAWSGVYVAMFLALLALYCARIAARDAAADYGRPTPTVVESPDITVEMPAGWQTYSRSPAEIRLHRRADAAIPLIEVRVDRDPGFRYQALDVNRALVLRLLEPEVADERCWSMARPVINLLGLEQVQVKPGLPGVRVAFSVEDKVGSAALFLLGDRRYLIWGLADRDDRAEREDIRNFIRYTFDTCRLPEVHDGFVRQVVDSSRFTAESNRRTQEEVQSSLAMWRLFSARAEREPAAALLPAISHFREAVRLLASIRQESSLVSSPDFGLYEKLMAIREAEVNEWFVLLDRYESTGDLPEAIRQATYICDHATLAGEAHLARRAADRRAALEARSANGGK